MYRCQKCGSYRYQTAKHPGAEVRCLDCGFIIRNEGSDQLNLCDPPVYNEETGIIYIDVDDDLLLKLALEAHKQDITLNQHINNILIKFMNKEIANVEKNKNISE